MLRDLGVDEAILDRDVLAGLRGLDRNADGYDDDDDGDGAMAGTGPGTTAGGINADKGIGKHEDEDKDDDDRAINRPVPTADTQRDPDLDPDVARERTRSNMALDTALGLGVEAWTAPQSGAALPCATAPPIPCGITSTDQARSISREHTEHKGGDSSSSSRSVPGSASADLPTPEPRSIDSMVARSREHTDGEQQRAVISMAVRGSQRGGRRDLNPAVGVGLRRDRNSNCDSEFGSEPPSKSKDTSGIDV